jgi:hypothetical protein
MQTGSSGTLIVWSNHFCPSMGTEWRERDSGQREGKRGTTNGGGRLLEHGGGSTATAWLTFMVSGNGEWGNGKGEQCVEGEHSEEQELRAN